MGDVPENTMVCIGHNVLSNRNNSAEGQDAVPETGVVEMTENIEHKCPNCGASLKFDIGSQLIRCAYCGCELTADALARNEGDLSVDAADVDLPKDAGREWDDVDAVSEYSCESCGGEIYTDVNTSATVCPYCGNAVIFKGRLSGVLKPDKVIPFKHTKEQALEELQKHIRSKKFVAKGFFEGNRLEEVKGLYVPFWVYDSEMAVDVTYDGVKESKSDNGPTIRKHYCVKRGGEIAFDHIPVDGSVKISDSLMESIEPFDYSKAEEFKTGYLTGYVADKYDVGQEQAGRRARRRMEEGAAEAFKKTVHGYTYVDIMDVRSKITKSNVDYVLYPVWLIGTEWNGKKFSFAMNGQTGKMTGNLPKNKRKFDIATALVFFLQLALITGALFYFTGSPNPVFIIVAVLFSLPGAAVFQSHFDKKLNNVEMKYGAKEYYRKDSMRVTSKSDEFQYKS